MSKISVLTVTIRPERVTLVAEALKKQSFKDWEWVIVCPDAYSLLGKGTVGGVNICPLVVEDPPKNEGDVWNFNKAMNAGIKASSGDLIVSIQDSVSFKPDALAKFWFHFMGNPNACVSGVGDQYQDETFTDKVWFDPRKNTKFGSFYECLPNDWELNFASLPRHLIDQIGGFDEAMDKWYGYDNVAVAQRLDSIGAKFYLDQTNESFSVRHGRSADWDEKNWINHGFQEYLVNRPIILDYLKGGEKHVSTQN